MAPTVRELSKAEEVALPDIGFLTQEELDALRANAEALKKSSSKLPGDFPLSLERVPRRYSPDDCSETQVAPRL